MMLILWYVATVAMLLVRTLAVSIFFATGTAMGYLYAFSEGLAVALAAANAMKVGRSVDTRPIGLMCPVLYLVGGMLVPVTQVSLDGPSAVLTACFAGIVVLRVYTCIVLGTAYTAGPVSWLGLVSNGPYRFVRHPLSFLTVAGRVFVLAAHASHWNVMISLVHLAAVAWQIRIEEGYLSAILPWREYAERVRWRLVPGIW